MAKRLLRDWYCVSKVKELGKYKFLATFVSKEDKMEARSTGRTC